MKLSFSTKGWEGYTWNRFCDKAEELGFCGIEIHDMHHPAFTGRNAVFDPAMIRATYRRLTERGLEVPCLDAIGDLADATTEAAYVEEVKACINTAAELHIPFIRMHALNPAEGEADMEAVYRRLSVLLPVAEGRDVTLLLETCGCFSDTAVLREMLDRFA